MPAGLAPLGVLYFTGIKLAGYSAAALYLRRQLGQPSAPVFVVGAARTILGLAAGIGAVSAAEHLGIHRYEIPFYLLLVPIRVCEWLLIIRVFFRSLPWSPERSLRLALLGTGWSFLLDVPAMLAMFVLPGGIWIC